MATVAVVLQPPSPGATAIRRCRRVLAAQLETDHGLHRLGPKAQMESTIDTTTGLNR